MNKSSKILILMLIYALLPFSSMAQGGITGPENQAKPTQENFLSQIKGLFDQANTTAQQAQQTSQDIQAKVDQSGAAGVLTKIWSALKSFFADKSMRDLVVDTLKLGLRVIANIFTIIANIIQRILAAM